MTNSNITVDSWLFYHNSISLFTFTLEWILSYINNNYRIVWHNRFRQIHPVRLCSRYICFNGLAAGAATYPPVSISLPKKCTIYLWKPPVNRAFHHQSPLKKIENFPHHIFSRHSDRKRTSFVSKKKENRSPYLTKRNQHIRPCFAYWKWAVSLFIRFFVRSFCVCGVFDDWCLSRNWHGFNGSR